MHFTAVGQICPSMPKHLEWFLVLLSYFTLQTLGKGAAAAKVTEEVNLD